MPLEFWSHSARRWPVAIALALLTGSIAGAEEPPDAAASGFAGSVSCRECHERFYTLWAPSHHGTAMQPYTKKLADAALRPATNWVEHGGVRFQPDISGEPGYVLAVEDGKTNRYEIVHVMGGKNVFYFLTPFDRGRLQVLPVAYDVHEHAWYDTTLSMIRHFSDREDAPLDWRDSMLTFNTACFACHVSQLSKNYDPEDNSYHTVWAEPGINCETCHSPGEEHVRLFRSLPKGEVPDDIKILSTRKLTPRQRDDSCAPCHAKMRPLTTDFAPGKRFFDHFDIVTLEDRDFYPDGRDLGENYTYTLWLTSPCVTSGQLECIHCHTSSGRFRFKEKDPNQACLPCHTDRVENVAAHSHHKAGTKGSECIACHMPMTTFARMRRSDHSMRPPTPAATLAFKSPNACNLCHDDQDAAWADAKVREWQSHDYQAPVLKRARLVDMARKEDWSHLGDILDYIQAPDSDPIFVTSLVRLLTTCPDSLKSGPLRRLTRHAAPLVRAAAAAGLRGDPDRRSLDALLACTRDDLRLVRISAAAALTTQSRELLKPADRQALDAATTEYVTSLTSRPDDWSSHYNLGNFYTDRGEFKKALEAFGEAVKFRDDVAPPLVNKAMLHARMGQMAEAEQCLRQAHAAEPDSAIVNFNLALLTAENGNRREAEQLLRATLRTDPRFATAAYNLGILLSEDKPDEALTWCRKAAQLAPDEPRYGYTLAFYLNQAGKTAEAEQELLALMRRAPTYPDAPFFLATLYEQQGRAKDARTLYETIAANAALPLQARREAQARLQNARP